MAAYYNEIDPFVAGWLRELIAAGLIAPGEVDERSIEDVTADDLRGFQQCHFFAGIGVWSHALRLAGWPDDRVVWTGSCPCQPFSAAGKRGGADDERHLWPAFFHLIDECRPPVVLSEQVASKDGLAWLDLVSSDMEGAGYAFGAVDTCAAGFGAPHIRQRLWFVGMADAAHQQQQHWSRGTGQRRWAEYPDGSSDGRMADSNDQGLEGRQQSGCEGAVECTAGPGFMAGGVEYNTSNGRIERRAESGEWSIELRCSEMSEWPGPLNGFWRDADWLLCRDGRWRPVESGTFPLAHGIANRVGLLRGAGNAIVSEQAAGFVEAVMDALGRS